MTDWSNAYAEHGTAVRAYLRSRTGSPEEAEDLCQETFTRAVTAPSPLRRAESLRAYLFQIAHNLLVNHLRRPRRELTGQAAASETVAGYEPRADERMDAHRLARRIEEHLRTLPEERRRCFQMAVLDGRPYAEVAEELGWTVSNVKIQVYRIRKKLTQLLPEEAKGMGHATDE